MVFQIIHPSNFLISGPTGSGKTQFCIQLLENYNRLCKTKIKTVYWCFSETNAKPVIKTTTPIVFLKGLPTNDIILNKKNEPSIIIIDDFMQEALSNQNIANLFTQHARHNNLTVMLLTQNIFHQSKYSRDISLNSKYIVVFRNRRDMSQIYHLARQLEPDNSKALVEVYKKVTALPYSYLLIDLNQTTPDLYKYRVDIFNKKHDTVFCKKPDDKTLIYDEKDKRKLAYAVCIGGN